MITGSLRALLSNIVDYAGLFPPAFLPLPEVVANYEHYLHSPEAWMLNRLVLPLTTLSEAKIDPAWRLTVLVDGEPGSLPPQVETLETKTGQRLSLPTYCEVAPDRVVNGYAKIRTNDPDPETLASFLTAAAERRMPFKATAGLHHPVRSESHGFLNVFLAATFALSGIERNTLVRLLNETDPVAFQFQDDGVRWRNLCASTDQIKTARRDFAHSFGSCSFEEPVTDLRALGLLP